MGSVRPQRRPARRPARVRPPVAAVRRPPAAVRGRAEPGGAAVARRPRPGARDHRRLRPHRGDGDEPALPPPQPGPFARAAGAVCRPGDAGVRIMKIPFSRPSIGEEEIAEVVDCLRSGWITTGSRTTRFEEDFAAVVHAPHALAVTSATAGLHLAMLALDLQPGDEVITTPLTWPATVNTIVLCGATPVLVDIEPDTLNLDVGLVESRLSPRTRAIVPVHFAGQPCDLDPLGALARAHNLRLVEDAAHALGAEYRGRPIGAIGDLTVFSFHPIKNITTGEGGMITTADEELARRVRLLRFHGVERDAWKAYGQAQLPLYDVTVPGLKYNLTDIQSAIGIHQLRKLTALNAERERLARRYDEALAGVPELRPLGRAAHP